ncbi:MAG: DinB family protein [Candidatus Sulfotelmatobacter sp.]
MPPKDSTAKQLRQTVVDLLNGGNAHATFDAAVSNVPEDLRGAKPNNFPHSPWMLLEHLRIAQTDILDFSRNPKYKAMKWPDDYWPKTPAPPNAFAWTKSIQQFRRDLKAMQALVANPKIDLYAPIAWGDGQTILREALLVADHNAYHIAQLIDVRRLLGDWKN